MILTPNKQGPKYHKTSIVNGNSSQFKAWPQQTQNNSAVTTAFAIFTKLLNDIQISAQKYRDRSFPPSISSLVKTDQEKLDEWSTCIWLRPEDFYGQNNYDIFHVRIEPNDIKQGALGDCYFLSTISSLAEWPDRIKKLFGTRDVNSNGCYCVRICDMGEWKEVVVDDYFPCDQETRQPIFTRGNGNELWVLILEKAWAKIHGSYFAIEAGFTTECLHDFTGAPTKDFFTWNNEEWEELWDQICEGERKQYAMTCGVNDAGGYDGVTPQGLVTFHAYSLLSAHEVETENGQVRLVRIRNPWGGTEWNGPWSDSSSEWTPELRQQLAWEDQDDGIFFMAYEDFLQYYADIQVCYIHDDYKYNSKRVTSDPRHAIYFKVQVDTPGEYYFTINQDSARKNAHNPNFSYSNVSLVIAKVTDDDKYEHMASARGADREIWTRVQLIPGEYIVHAKVEWTSGRDTDFVLSTYGESETVINVVRKQTYPDFLEETFISKARRSTEKDIFASKDESHCYRVVEKSENGFVYIYYQNNISNELEIEVELDLEGIKLRKPNRGTSYNLVIPAHQERIVLLKIFDDDIANLIFVNEAIVNQAFDN